MKQWPAFDADGDLPVGIHQATLAEVSQHFGTGSLRREMVARRLDRIYRFARSTGQLARFVVFGSFVTAKREPGSDAFSMLNSLIGLILFQPLKLV